jgi:hypothetical protein
MRTNVDSSRCVQLVFLEHPKLFMHNDGMGNSRSTGRFRAAGRFVATPLALQHVEHFGGGAGVTYQAEMAIFGRKSPLAGLQCKMAYRHGNRR